MPNRRSISVVSIGFVVTLCAIALLLPQLLPAYLGRNLHYVVPESMYSLPLHDDVSTRVVLTREHGKPVLLAANTKGVYRRDPSHANTWVRLLELDRSFLGIDYVGDLDGDGADDILMNTGRGHEVASIVGGAVRKEPALSECSSFTQLSTSKGVHIGCWSGEILRSVSTWKDGEIAATNDPDPASLAAKDTPGLVATGDIDDDGIVDAIAHQRAGMLTVLRGAAPAVPDLIRVPGLAAPAERTLTISGAPLVDLNGDGANDLVFATSDLMQADADSIRVLYGRVGGAPRFVTKIGLGRAPLGIRHPFTTDVNADGLLDVVSVVSPGIHQPNYLVAWSARGRTWNELGRMMLPAGNVPHATIGELDDRAGDDGIVLVNTGGGRKGDVVEIHAGLYTVPWSDLLARHDVVSAARPVGT